MRPAEGSTATVPVITYVNVDPTGIGARAEMLVVPLEAGHTAPPAPTHVQLTLARSPSGRTSLTPTPGRSTGSGPLFVTTNVNVAVSPTLTAVGGAGEAVLTTETSASCANAGGASQRLVTNAPRRDTKKTSARRRPRPGW